MATEAEHQEKAAHNDSFLGCITDKYPDWLATAAFYAAVHYVEKLEAKSGRHSTDHFTRKKSVHKNYPSLRSSYDTLYNASMTARYDALGDCLAAERVHNELIRKHLSKIRSFVTTRV